MLVVIFLQTSYIFMQYVLLDKSRYVNKTMFDKNM